MTPATRSLLRAAADGDTGLVRALLSQGTDIDGKTASGQTPLMLAAAFGHTVVVELLLAAGANVDLQDELGLSAQDWAARTPGIAQLLERKAQTDEQSENKPETEPVRRPPVELSDQPDTEPVSTVVFPDPKAFAKDKTDISGAGLGGLAGAILRDRKSTNEQQGTGNRVSTNGPTAHSGFSPTTSPLLSHRQSPPDEMTSESLQGELRRETHTSVTEEQDTSDSEIRQDQIASKKVAEDDETTISGKRATQPESANTLPRGRTLFPHEPVIYGPSTSPRANPRMRKVEVPVPSFSALSGYNSARLVRWALIVIFLLAGATGGYFLSKYLLNRDSGQTVVPTAPAVAQPTPAPPKPGPLVGGELAGSELFLPDAEYPNITSSPGNANASGNVTVQVNVNQRGTVKSAKAIDGDARLQPSAVAAAKKASFSPDKLKGKGRSISGTVTYTFVSPEQQPTQTSNVQSSTSPARATSDASNGTGDSAEAPSPKVSGALAGAELDLPQAAYPAKAKAQGIAGTVTIVVRVNRAGRVVSWRTADGDSRLRSAALTAAKKSTFSPAKLPGTGDVVGTITYTFQ